MSSKGKRSISARATVSPPKPEANMPMGRSITASHTTRSHLGDDVTVRRHERERKPSRGSEAITTGDAIAGGNDLGRKGRRVGGESKVVMFEDVAPESAPRLVRRLLEREGEMGV